MSVAAEQPTGTESRLRTRRILVLANETCGYPLCDVVREHAGRAEHTELLVIAPALTRGRLDYWANDVDAAERWARERLDYAVSCLTGLGLTVRGRVGDPDPAQALADALHEFAADEIVIATHPEERSNWLEKHVVERAGRFGVPVSHVVVDRRGTAA